MIVPLILCVTVQAALTAGTAQSAVVTSDLQSAPRFPCSPFSIATGVQRVFDAVSAGRPARAVERVLGPANSDTLFDQYQFGARGAGISVAAPINQISTLRSSLLRTFMARAKQHDSTTLLGLHVEAVGSYTRDSVGFTVGLTRRADDLRHRTLLYGVAKGGWLCGSHMVQRFFGAVLLDQQRQMRYQATHICAARARRIGSIGVCW